MERSDQGVLEFEVAWPPRSRAHDHTRPSLILLTTHERRHRGLFADLSCVPTRQDRSPTSGKIIGAPANNIKAMREWLWIFLTLPKFEGWGSIMVVVECYSKCATFIASPIDCKVDKATRLFIKHIVKLWGVLKSIVSNWDSWFTNQFWKELFKMLGTDLKFSTSIHPQADGQTECINSLLEMYLRHYVIVH